MRDRDGSNLQDWEYGTIMMRIAAGPCACVCDIQNTQTIVVASICIMEIVVQQV